jgi:hypothetical protein
MSSRTSSKLIEEDEYEIEYILDERCINRTYDFINENLINYANKFYYNNELLTKITDMYCNEDSSALRLNFPDLEIICIELIKENRYYDDSFKLYMALPEQLNGHYKDMDVDSMPKILFKQTSYDPHQEYWTIRNIDSVII